MEAVAASYEIVTQDFKTIYAIGDIHGDFGLMMILLHHCAGVVDSKGKWCPSKKNVCVVFVGDTIDRYRKGLSSLGEFDGEELFIHIYLNYLSKKARECNSRVIKCLGNHEEMNMNGQFHCVTPKGRRLRELFPITPGSFFARQIYSEKDTYPFVLVNKQYFFVHGGIYPLNDENKDALEQAPKRMKQWFRKGTKPSGRESKKVYALVHEMLWDREFTNTKQCDNEVFKNKLSFVGAQYMLSGHSITGYNRADDSQPFNECQTISEKNSTQTCTQNNNNKKGKKKLGINCSCSGKVFRLDNGASRGFGSQTDESRKPQLLKIDCNRPPTNPTFSVIKYNDDWANHKDPFLQGIGVASLKSILLSEIEQL